MTTVSTIQLIVLGLMAGAAMQPDQRLDAGPGPFSPNYNFSPDSPEAILLGKLANRRPHITYFQDIKTLPRAYFDDYLDGAQDYKDELPKHSIARQILEHLVQQRAAQAKQWGWPYTEVNGQAEYLYTNSPNRAIPQTDGSTNPLLAMREGEFSESGHHGVAGATARGSLAPWFSYEVAPRGLFSTNDAGMEEQATFRLHRGYAKFNIRNFEVELGKDTVQWGFGKYSSMLFSGNAESFYLLRLGNSVPTRLPFFFKLLGPARIDFFVTVMDGDQVLPHSILQAMKTTIMPHPRVELAFAQSVQFGGEGSDSWNPLNYFAEGLTGDLDVNRNFTIDMRWRIPVVEIEPYVELFWEDCCQTVFINPRDVLNLVGLYIPNIGPRDQADLAIEWVRTNEITYRHNQYTSGFIYKGFLIGHPIGRDGDGIYGIFRYFHSPRSWGKAIVAYEQRRNDNVPREDRYRLQLNWFHQFNRHLRANFEGGYERTVHFNFTPGDDRNNFMAGFALEIL